MTQRLGPEGPPGAAPATYSADGRWYWDGSEWRPVPAPAPGRAAADPTLARLGRWLTVLLAVGAVSTLPTSLSYLLDLATVAGLLDRSLATPIVLAAYLFVGLTVCSFGAVGVLLGVWAFRAHRNLSKLDPGELNWTPQWAALSWWIPAIQLVVPFLVIRELWSGTRRPGEQHWWWLWVWEAAWVMAAGVTIALQQVVSHNNALNDIVTIVFYLSLATAAALLIPTVSLLTRRQQERLAEAA